MQFALQWVDWKRVLVLLPLLAAFGILFYFFFVLGDNTSGTPRASLLETDAPSGLSVGTRQGNVARDFLGYSPDGAPVRLSDLRGRPTIINFWATWCASCTVELPDLRDLQTEVGSENLNVVAVNAGESSGTARKFMDSLQAPDLRVAMDPTIVVADAYGVRGMPQSVFLDSDGIVRAVYAGQLTKDRMQQYLAAAANGVNASSEPGPLRLLTTVARDHVLEVDVGEEDVTYRSKSLRCDDLYCSASVIATLSSATGVLSIERRLDADPALITVRFDKAKTSEPAITSALVGLLNAKDDPLYTAPLHVR